MIGSKMMISCLTIGDLEGLKIQDGEGQISSCVKCKTLKGQFLIRHSAYCHDCFLHSVSHKFRSNFTKSKMKLDPAVYDATRILIHFTGSYKSLCLIHNLVFPERDRNCKKVFLKNSGVKYIVCHIWDHEDENEAANSRALSRIISETYGLEYMPVPLARIQEFPLISDLLSKIPLGSQKRDLIESHGISKLVRRIALEQKVSIVLSEESGTDVACKLFAQMSRGNGFSLPFETNWIDSDNDQGIAIIRPLREHLDKELALYCHLKKCLPSTLLNINPLSGLARSAKVSSPSVEQITKDFFVSLDQAYPSTISTVFKTSLKIKTAADSQDSSNTSLPRCLLCDRKIQPNARDWIRASTIYSLDQMKDTHSPSSAPLDCQKSGSDLCYSCSRVFQSDH